MEFDHLLRVQRFAFSTSYAAPAVADTGLDYYMADLHYSGRQSGDVGSEMAVFGCERIRPAVRPRHWKFMKRRVSGQYGQNYRLQELRVREVLLS